MRVTRNDVDRFFEHGLDMSTRTIYMGSVGDDDGGTDYRMAERIVKALHVLGTHEGPINILMNNFGGDEYHGFAIMDAITACPAHVTVTAFGHAMSMGSLIMQVADDRVMAPLSRMMVHYGTWGYYDNSKSSYNWADEGKKIDKWMVDLYLGKIREKHPGFTRKKVDEMLNFDTILDAQETVDLGLADRVLNG